MPYERRYNYKGIETLLDNVVRIITRDMAAELNEIAQETGDDPLEDFNEVLINDKDNPVFPCIVIKPDEDDAIENEDSSGIAEANQFRIAILTRGSDLEEQTRNILRYKKAVRNVLWSAEKDDLMLGINGGSCVMDVRGGRYAWVKVQNIYGSGVIDMLLTVRYGE